MQLFQVAWIPVKNCKMLLMIVIIFSLSQVSAQDVCREKILYDIRFTGERQRYTIPETPVGETYKLIVPCEPDTPSLTLAVGEITCMNMSMSGWRHHYYSVVWGDFQVNIKCHSISNDTSAVTVELYAIVKDITHVNAKNYLRRMKTLSSDIATITDVLYTTYILDQIVNSTEISYQDAVNCIHIVNNIQNLPSEILDFNNEIAKKRLMAILEQLELKVQTYDEGDVGNSHAQFVTDKMVVAVWDIRYTDTEPVIGLRVDGELTQPMEVNTIVPIHHTNHLYTENTIVGIRLNNVPQLIINGNSTSKIRLAVHVFNKPSLFTTNMNNNDVINSYIIGMTLAVDDKPIRYLKHDNITMVFRPNQILQEHVREKYTKYGHWADSYWYEFSALSSSTTDGKDTCTTQSLGNFVLILDHNGLNFVRKLFLSKMVIIGMFFSLSCYAFCFLGWIFVRKLRRDPFWVHFRLLLVVLVPYSLHLWWLGQPDGHTEARVLWYTTSYFVGSAMTCLLTDGILHHSLFVKVRTKKSSVLLLKSSDKSAVYCIMGLLTCQFGIYVLPTNADEIVVDTVHHIILYMAAFASVACCYYYIVWTIPRRSKITDLSRLQKILAFCCSVMYCGMNVTFGILMLRDVTFLYQTIFAIVNMVQNLLIVIRFIAGFWSNDDTGDDEQPITDTESQSSNDNDGILGPLVPDTERDANTLTNIDVDDNIGIHEEKKPLTETSLEPIVEVDLDRETQPVLFIRGITDAKVPFATTAFVGITQPVASSV
ncbi:hypothetical protein SNE40_022135 [Patella caerulea]|uniref:Uncharacterized protein n=1 Tax=Patella caerulea TaxID=87958 RepID=A0AAN8IZP0_PATCE